ncbi:MAG: relaxase/mobilization nuclease domain-containing protein [Candidatus Thiodiazotropha taylori]|nr:relaxase/mobilization nuclease domain-containing protein [Candidatus Thiodiazotropha taylori]MCW4305961.1 relaxase/mobilization nuclease domain-containing protein [Candidatus Thiodiazotropha taylori]
MILKLSLRGNRQQLADHLASDENERVSPAGSRGVMSEDMGGAMAEMEAQAKGSTTQKYLIHVSLSPSPGEEMTPAKWARAWEVFEQVQGLENHAYSAVEHEKQDRTHQHRVYSRVDMDTG